MWCHHVIKQNEFEVGQIQFSVFWLTAYSIWKATFSNRLHWKWSISSKDTGSWRVAKTIGNKEIICFVWLYLKIDICEFRLILLDHITYVLRPACLLKGAWSDPIGIFQSYCNFVTIRMVIFFWSSFWNFKPLFLVIWKKTSKMCLFYWLRITTI